MPDETPISDFRDFIRAVIGDSHPVIKQFAPEQIDAAVRLTVNLGKAPGITLTTDGAKVTPAVLAVDPFQAKNWARIVLHSARRFVDINAASSSYRFRAMSESFGESKELIFSLLTEIYEMEYGEGGE